MGVAPQARIWTAYLDRLGAKPSTRKSYGSILKNVLPTLGQLQLTQVTPLHIEELVQRRSKKVGAKTLLNEIGLLQSIFSLAVENDLLERSPVRSKHKPKVLHSEKPIWTPDQVKRILSALPDQHRALFHRFRHSAGSFVNSQTGNLKLAQRLLGHSRFETTANVYTHALSEEERAAAVAVEEAIFGDSSHLFLNENCKGPGTVN